jgi:hypothetical protein
MHTPGENPVVPFPDSITRSNGRFGAGHYWFTAWLTTGKQVLLAAGEAEVK